MDGSEGTKLYDIQMLQASVDESYKVENGFQFIQQEVEHMNESPKIMFDYIVGHVFTPMTEEVGIKKHGLVAIDALFKEFAQVHNLEVFEGILASNSIQEQRRNALASIDIIKEKLGEGIKRLSVADYRKHKSSHNKDDITSTTVSTYALLMTFMIDAWD